MNKSFFLVLIIIMTICTSCKKQVNQKQLLRICFKIDPLTLDPRKTGDLFSSTIVFMLYEGLMHVDKEGKITPGIAKSCHISDDEKTYTFNLRDSFWSDGMPVTAYDFEKSWKKILDPKFPSLCTNLLYCIKNAEEAALGKTSLDNVKILAKDEKTLVVELNNPTPYFLSLTSFCVLSPAPSHIDEKNPNWEKHANNNLVSNGPFKLNKWKLKNEICLDKNPLYWNAKDVSLQNIHISIIDNENTALEMFENKELDWLGATVSPIPSDSITNIINKPETKTIPIGGTNFCAFNLDKFPFHNINIRKAFAYAINRKEIIENITQLNETIATRCFCPTLVTNNKSFFEDNNASLARKYFEKGLKELNISPNDLNITFLYGGPVVRKKQAEAMQQQWKKALNIDVKLEYVEEKILFDRLHKRNFQLSMAMWVIQYDDPMDILSRFKYKNSCKNYPGWENENYIKTLDLARATKDVKTRYKIMEEAEEIILKEMPLAPIFHYNYVTLTHPHVKNIVIGSIGDIHFENVYLDNQKQ